MPQNIPNNPYEAVIARYRNVVLQRRGQSTTRSVEEIMNEELPSSNIPSTGSGAGIIGSAGNYDIEEYSGFIRLEQQPVMDTSIDITRRTIEYSEIHGIPTYCEQTSYGQVRIISGDNLGCYIANYPGYPKTRSQTVGITAPTIGELEERAANKKKETNRTYFDPFKSKSKSSLYSRKLEYIYNIKEDELLKQYNFISGSITVNNNQLWSYYMDRELSNGLRIAFKSYLDKNNRPVSLFDETVDIETFKSNIYLCYLKSDKLSMGELSTFDNDLVLSINSSNYLSFQFNRDMMKMTGSIDGLNKSQGDNGTVYYDKSKMPKYLKVFKMTDLTGERLEISEIREIIESESGIIQDIYVTFRNLLEIVSNRYSEMRRMYVINMRRPNTRTKKYQSVPKGIYVSHSIPFSCEIECYGKNKNVVAKVSNEIDEVIGMSGDGSLNSDIGYPIEIQTPILRGKKGEICVAELCTKLVENSFIIDKTCGLHIHLDGSVLSLEDVKVRKGQVRPTSLINLYLAYRLFEPVILSFLPSTRRRNEYCADFGMSRDYHGEVISFDPVGKSFSLMNSINTLEAFELYWYKATDYNKVIKAKGSRYTPSRYFGVNFHSLLKDNHLEIRYHSGTLNYEKILFWIDLHGKMVDKCVDGTINIETLTNVLHTEMNLEQLTEYLFSILNLNKDTVEYLMDRQSKFKDVKLSEEILINKTKKLGVA